jgi:hypothetical protein
MEDLLKILKLLIAKHALPDILQMVLLLETLLVLIRGVMERIEERKKALTFGTLVTTQVKKLKAMITS